MINREKNVVKLIYIIFVVTLLLPSRINAVTATKEEKIDAVMETAYAYYRQKSQIQYDSYRKNYYSTPEDATFQNTIYTVCSGLTFQTYYQALGIKIPEYTKYLMEYANKNKDNKEVVLFYYNKNEIYSSNVFGEKNGTSNISNLIAKWNEELQSGDILVVEMSPGKGGHTMLINKEDGELKIIHSTGTRYKPDSYSEVYEDKGSIVNEPIENILKFYYNRTITSMTALRFINDSYSYINQVGEIEKYDGITNSAKTRLDYPGIDIEKMLEIDDSVTSKLVNINEKMTYTITIKNNSTTNYSNLYLAENIDSNVDVIDNGNGVLSGNQIRWDINSLSAGQTILISYSVKVKKDKSLLGKIIVSTGKVNDIATSRVETVIGNKLTTEQKNKVINSFNKLKDNKDIEKKFIDDVYFDALGIDLGLNNLKFLDIIGSVKTPESYDSSELVVKHSQINDTNIKNMVYHNLYGLRINEIIIGNGNWNYYTNSEINDRARTITNDLLETGDIILLYTGKDKASDANLIDKAYIYVDGKLYRKIESNKFEEINGNDLTVFLRNIIAENYVVLKPSFIMAIDVDDNSNIPSTEEKVEKDDVTENPKTGFKVSIICIGTLFMISICCLFISYKENYTIF